MAISLNQETVDELNTGMQMGGAIELPFAAPVWYTINGDARLKQIGGAQYFGGWATDAAKLLDIWVDQGAPIGADRVDRIAGDNKTLDEFVTRSLLVAPIAMRKSWFVVDRGGQTHRSPDYFAGARQHIQTIVYMAVRNQEGKIAPWNVAVLSAKGFQAKNLFYSFSDWDKHTKSLRNRVAPGVPAWCFYLAIGTFGKDRVGKAVGQEGAQSQITPIGAYLPKDLSEATLEGLFVGQDVADIMVSCKREAQEWLNAWGQQSPREEGHKNGPALASPEDSGYWPENPPEEEIPF